MLKNKIHLSLKSYNCPRKNKIVPEKLKLSVKKKLSVDLKNRLRRKSDCPSNVPGNYPLMVQDPKFLVKDSFRYKKNILFEKKVLFCTFCAQFALCNHLKYFKVSIKY